jgi:hypothetical protein
MPHLDFYFNDEERIELVDYILSKGSKIIPDKKYLTKEYEVIRSVDDYIVSMKERECSFFILDEGYTFEELSFSSVELEVGLRYYINQRHGGPYIDICFYLGYASDAIIPCKRSNIDHYSKFMYNYSYDEFKTPEALKAYYKDLSKFINKKCQKIKKDGFNFVVSKEVLKTIKL